MKEQNNPSSKILIVDDEQKNIQFLGSLLKQANYIVGVATNGKQAIDILFESDDYDLVLLDINMPVLGGFETCQLVRANEKLKDLPIIFLTAMVDAEAIVNGFKVGGQDYLTKPFNSDELLARVNTHIELKKSRDQLKGINKWLENEVDKRTIELKVANTKLQRLDTAKSEFLRIISHELRTPLNGILGVIPILDEYDFNDQASVMLNILNNSALRLEELSLKALDISLLNTKGKDALILNKSDMIDVLNTELSKAKTKLSNKNMGVVVTDNLTNSTLNIDPVLMGKCLSLIIDNAIKFGNRNTDLKVNAYNTTQQVVLTVEDQGKHFPENVTIEGLQPFSTPSHIDGNPSLSLFLCKQIIDAHNGAIQISNTPDGVVVAIYLPAIP